eukprot:tig00000383_g24720.t1
MGGKESKQGSARPAGSGTVGPHATPELRIDQPALREEGAGHGAHKPAVHHDTKSFTADTDPNRWKLLKHTIAPGSCSARRAARGARGILFKRRPAGETLSEICKKTKTPTAAVKKFNSLEDESHIEAGKDIILPYKVQPGDTLSKIAKGFGTTVDMLKQDNNLSGDMIQEGTFLSVYDHKKKAHAHQEE